MEPMYSRAAPGLAKNRADAMQVCRKRRLIATYRSSSRKEPPLSLLLFFLFSPSSLLVLLYPTEGPASQQNRPKIHTVEYPSCSELKLCTSLAHPLACFVLVHGTDPEAGKRSVWWTTRDGTRMGEPSCRM